MLVRVNMFAERDQIYGAGRALFDFPEVLKAELDFDLIFFRQLQQPG
jgi:hypothetical protein